MSEQEQVWPMSFDAGAYEYDDHFGPPVGVIDVSRPWPRFVLFPRLERARIAAQEAHTRVRVAWSVLRGHETGLSEWGDM